MYASEAKKSEILVHLAKLGYSPIENDHITKTPD